MTEKPPTQLAKRMRAARIKAKMSQAQIAEKMGIHRTLVSLYESGRRVPGLLRLKTLAWICDVDPAWLAFGPQDKTSPRRNTGIIRNPNQGELDCQSPQAPAE